MRFQNLALAILALLSASTVARAANCDLRKPPNPVTDAREIRISDAVTEHWKAIGSPSDRLVFALPSATDDSIKFVDLIVPAGVEIVKVRPEIAVKLAKAKEVRVFNFANQQDSLYFAPFAQEELKGFHPRSGCADAWEEKPAGSLHAGTGCSTLDLGGLENFTVLAGTVAANCDQIHQIQRDAVARQGDQTGPLEKFMKDTDTVLYEPAIVAIEKVLKISHRLDRSPELEQARLVETGDAKVDQQRKKKRVSVAPVGTKKPGRAIPKTKPAKEVAEGG